MATPRKTKRRNNQVQPQPQQACNAHAYNPQHTLTDYETDYPDPQPPPMTRSNDELNISVLRRHWPDISILLSIAPYVVLYTYSPTGGQWEKTGVEGPLFVCALASHDPETERFGVIILNKKGLDNFQTEIKSSDAVEVTEEFVILTGDEGKDAQGLWIYADPEPHSTAHSREVNAGVIQECATRAETSRKRAMEQIAEKQRERERMQDLEQDRSNGSAAEESELEESSVPMGRQLSLRELFGKQREDDNSFGVHTHQSPRGSFSHEQAHPQPSASHPAQTYPIGTQTQNYTAQIHQEEEKPTPPAPAPAHVPTPQFQTHPDTDFFRSGPRFAPPALQEEHSGHGAGHGAPVNGGNALLEDMFRRARTGL
jgi:hypothetical protein